MGYMPWGTHFCHFYETKSDLLDILIPYFKTGLENNEFCVWIVFNPLDQVEARNALRQAAPETDRYLAEGALEIIPHSQWYLRDGVLDVERAMAGFREKLDHALKRGFDGLRGNGSEAAVPELVDIEDALDECEVASYVRSYACEVAETVGREIRALPNSRGAWRWQTRETALRRRFPPPGLTPGDRCTTQSFAAGPALG